MSRSFKIVGPDGKESEDAAHYFNQAWFRQLMKLSLDSVYWGHSLIELGEVVTDGDGCICYDGVKLIPRKHVIPEYGRVITDLGQDWTTGIEYRKPPFTDWLIEAGEPDDLGKFLKAATQTIPKRMHWRSGTHLQKYSVCQCVLQRLLHAMRKNLPRWKR